MNYFYYVVDIEQNGKYYSHLVKTNESTNIYNNALFNQPGTVAITQYKTLKKARFIVENNNAQFKKDNVYMFQDGPLF